MSSTEFAMLFSALVDNFITGLLHRKVTSYKAFDHIAEMSSLK